MTKKTFNKCILWTVFVLFSSFILTQRVAKYFVEERIAKEKQLVQHTAQTTALHFESKIEKYLSAADFLKNYLLLHGEEATAAAFPMLAPSIMDNNGVIQCIELAKDGTIDYVYPLKGNKHVLGLNLLTAEKRSFEASIARKTGKYTIAGPFSLVQGGIGALLLDPIYVQNSMGKNEFWGFAVVVIDWEAFVDEVNLQHLEKSGYHYSIWHKDPYTGQKANIAASEQPVSDKAIQVSCPMPNDLWYVDIEVAGGWIAPVIQEAYLGFAMLISILLTIGYWQFATGRYKEQEHKQQLEVALAKANVANESKTRFLFSMSHDIRTPMNAILGFTAIAKASKDMDQIKDCLSKIGLAGDLLLKLINEVLNISRIESGTLKPILEKIDLQLFAKELEMLFKQSMLEKSLDFKVNCVVKNRFVEADSQHMQAICVN